MVGFKFFTLTAVLITSMVITGCIPQAKQTQCGPDEAFNPVQRRCLPVNPSETSFIKIKSAVPTGGITQTASSGTAINFTVMVENPYNKSYRVRWLRNFNGSQSTLYTPSQPSSNITDHPYNIGLVPNSDLYGAVGRHVITAQILDALSNNVLDSHDFSLELTNDPTPNGQGFTPGLSSPINLNPINTNLTFAFNVERNNRLMNTPIVRWRLTKLTGTIFPDLIENTPLSQALNSQPVSFFFNPSNPFKEAITPTAPFLDYVGNYRLEASIMDGTTNFSTYSWELTIRHPSLGVISSSHTPVPGDSASSIRAFNGVPYADATASNFSYFNSTIRGQFCVQVSDPDGRYGNGVIVRYYLGNSTGAVYSGTTNGSDDTICLEDAPLATKNSVVFSDSNPDLSWSTSIKARVFDAQTNEEYSTYSAGAYPLIWNIFVEPQNKAPQLSFTDVAGSVACSSVNGTGTVRSGCQVIQDQSAVNKSFVIAFNVTDEHYSGVDLDSNISYQANLTRGATSIDSTSCLKNFTDVGATTDDGVSNIDDFQGPTYTCRFNVPAFDDLGSINPTLDAWKVTVNVSDSGSPYTTTQKSTSLVWELSVRELNTTPVASTQVSQNLSPYLPIVTATEKDTIVFTVNYSDLERDPYRVELYRCESAVLCSETLSPLVSSSTAYYTASDWAINRRLTFTIPDGFVPDQVAPTTVRFRVRVIDSASTGTAVDDVGAPAANHVVDNFITLDINNFNPAPIFAQPNFLDVNSGVDFTVFGSFPITLDPGVISDASNPLNTSEGTITYQWWISPDNTAWTSITGATQKLLRWSPGTEIVSANYYIKLCITDNSPLRTGQENPNGSGLLCNTPALVKVENNIGMSELVDFTIDNRRLWGAPAVWVDTTPTGSVATHANSKVIYAAWGVRSLPTGTPSEAWDIDNVQIHVAKFFYNADNNGQLQKLEEFSFDALDTWDSVQTKTFDVKDIQLTGDENSLYIGYLAYLRNTVDDDGYRPEVRRIQKSFGVAYNKGERTSSVHPAPFGFGYYGYFVRHDQAGCACWDLGDPQVAPINVQDGITILTTTTLNAGSVIDFSLNGTDWVSFTVAAGTETQRADDLVTQINASTQSMMKGFVARLVGANQVEIWGPLLDDYKRINQVAEKLGKIFVDNGMLYLPFINSSTPSPNAGSISIASFPTNATRLATEPVSQVNFAGTTALDFDNVLDRDGNLLIAFISNNEPGQAKLIKFMGMDINNPPAAQNILGGKSLTRIKVSSNQAALMNDNYFVMGRASDSKLWISRIPTDLSDLTRVWGFEDTLDPMTAATVASLPLVYDFHIRTAMSDSVSTSLDEGRILLNTADGVYAFRAMANQTVSCGDCLPISRARQLPPSLGHRTMDLSAIIAGQTLGSSGNVFLTESTRNMMVYVHAGQDTTAANPEEQRLFLGIINADRTVVDPTTRDDGNGYYTPAIFKN